MYTVHSSNSEYYYLRLFKIYGWCHISHIPASTSACKALGLLEDDKHWDATMEEAALCDSPFKLRELFSVLLIFCQLTKASSLWEKYKHSLSEDIKRQIQSDLGENVLQIMDEAYNKCLIYIEDIVLSLGGQRLNYYGLPQPLGHGDVTQKREYIKKISYDTNLLAEVVSNREKALAEEQFQFYKQVLDNMETGTGQIVI